MTGEKKTPRVRAPRPIDGCPGWTTRTGRFATRDDGFELSVAADFANTGARPLFVASPCDGRAYDLWMWDPEFERDGSAYIDAPTVGEAIAEVNRRWPVERA